VRDSNGATQGVAFMNKTAARSVIAVVAVTLAMILGYLEVRGQLGADHESLSPSSGHITAHEREEAFLNCLKMQADGCYME
jgi:hypothetical protein